MANESVPRRHQSTPAFKAIRRDETLHIRLTAEEYLKVRQAAHIVRMAVATWCRTLILTEADVVIEKKDNYSG